MKIELHEIPVRDVVNGYIDSADKGAIDQGKALLAENDAEYLNLMFPEDYEKQLGKQLSFPTTLMVDSSGTVLGSIEGAAIKAYEPVMQKLLAEERNAA